MRSSHVDGDLRLSLWRRVREFAVPRSMIEAATARRVAGDWAGACAVARVDVDLDLRAAARVHGAELAAEVRADLRHFAPDLLRWHMPRMAPDGLLRAGLTVTLARYGVSGAGTVHLVARTAPAWADAAQRISLALWTGHATDRDVHPHPHPDRRFRLDLHRPMWDARHAPDLAARAGAQHWPPPRGGPGTSPPGEPGAVPRGEPDGLPPGCATHRWAAEAEILRDADGRTGVPVLVRAGRRRLVLDGSATPPRVLRGPAPSYPVLPHAATWVLPDLELLRAGLIDADRLHPLVAAALRPQWTPAGAEADTDRAWRTVECGDARHRIGLRHGVLTALDHDPDEVRREELFAALGGTPSPCLRVIDAVHRDPEPLAEIRARLDHGDNDGALAAVEELLGPAAVLRDGALRDEFESAVARQVTYGLYRSGLAGRGPLKTVPQRKVNL
ncbi:hypothetical protein [Virgisporangium aurantiacum]|nr:hypothetical protein [Virgisporangium aurantiacum]